MTDFRIVQTIGSIAERSGGPARTIRALSQSVARAGGRVDLLAGHDPDRDDGLLLPDAALVTTHLIRRSRRLGLPFYPFAPALAAADPAAAILNNHGIWNAASFDATTAARRLGIPYVVSPHGMLEPWALAFHPIRKRAAWALYQFRAIQGAVGLTATANQELDSIRRKVPGKPIAVIPNGVDCPPTVPDRSARDAPQPRTLLFLSRIHPKKNLPALLDAWASLASDPGFADWTLWIAGPDELNHRAELAAQVARLRLDHCVRLEGPVPEARKAAAFAAADLFVLPSFSENFGIVIAEALAAGVPAVATHGAPWSMLPAFEAGWYVLPNAAALATALRQGMALPPAARRAMGVRGHALVARSFGWERIGRQTLDYYSWLLGRGPRPDFVDG